MEYSPDMIEAGFTVRRSRTETEAQAEQQQLAMREKAKVQAYEDMAKKERAKLEQETQTNDQTSEQTL